MRLLAVLQSVLTALVGPASAAFALAQTEPPGNGEQLPRAAAKSAPQDVEPGTAKPAGEMVCDGKRYLSSSRIYPGMRKNECWSSSTWIVRQRSTAWKSPR